MGVSRRAVGLAGLGLATAAIGSPRPARGRARARVVVIGGGAGGASCARILARDGSVHVVLVEERPQYTTCFASNHCLAGWRSVQSITFGYAGLQAAGVTRVPVRAVAIDPAAKAVRLGNGETLAYDTLVVAPGIDLTFGSVDGYSEHAAGIMPHAWKAGAQTVLLRNQLEAMPDGGLFVIAAPPAPYRCPPAPYERASLVAEYFTRAKPRSKILILDAKGSFSKQPLFEEAWRTRYKGMIEWVPADMGGRVAGVDAKAMTVTSADGDIHKADVANIVPAQAAGRIAREAGLADESGWCPVTPASMASRRHPGIHVLGDAADAHAMPKSAFAANSQAVLAATAIRAELTGGPVVPLRAQNICWSVLAPGDAVKIGASYEPGAAAFESRDAFVSEVGESRALREATRAEADAWYDSVTADIFG